MNHDQRLIKIVHTETVGDYSISSMLDRFGGLTVIVEDRDGHGVWQGDNILAARSWANMPFADAPGCTLK